jgi:hypothetical protein
VNPRRPRPSGFPTARGDRSHRGRRPKPPDSVRVPSPPAEAGGELAPGRSRCGRFPGSVVASPTEVGGVSTGEAGASCPPIDLPPTAEAVGGRRLPKRASGGGEPAGARCLPKQASGRLERVCASCRSRKRGTRVGRCLEAAEAVGTSGPVRGVCRSRLRGDRSLPERAGKPPSSIPGRGGLRPTEVGPEPEDPVLGLLDAPIRRSGPPHPPGGPGRERRGGPVPKHLPPSPLGRRSSRHPPGEPVSRSSRSDALRGSGRLRGLAPLTSPLRPHHRFQRWAARVSHGLYSPSRSSHLRGCPPDSSRRSARVRWRLPRAEARGLSWEGSLRRLPGGGRVGPCPHSES